jgi:kanamycin kinase/aminoglycoside 3'-phosphotransferase-3
MNSEFPSIIHEYIKGMQFTKDTIGCSGADIYCFSDTSNTMYLKRDKANHEFEVEQNMMQWLQGVLPVPKIIARCRENEDDYLLMTKAPGITACSQQYLSRPELLVKLLAEGIKMLQSLDYLTCPFDNSLKFKLALAKERIDNGYVDTNDWEDNNEFQSPIELYDYLIANQPEEELTFAHGDYCLPNIFFDNDQVSCFIDLGRAGIADKWQDIALCVRSLEHNLDNSKYTDLLFEYLGIQPDAEKIRYYILLDELF